MTITSIYYKPNQMSIHFRTPPGPSLSLPSTPLGPSSFSTFVQKTKGTGLLGGSNQLFFFTNVYLLVTGTT